MLTSKSKLRPLYFASKQVLAAGILLCAAASGVHASSHREAPLIATMPKVDGTDFYMFNSYEPNRHGYVTLIANYSPLEDAYGGPNYYSLDPTALYEIHIDNVGDGKEHLTFQFRFKNTLTKIARQVRGGITSFTKPTDFIGTKTFGSVSGYASYARQYVYTIDIPGCRAPGRVF